MRAQSLNMHQLFTQVKSCITVDQSIAYVKKIVEEGGAFPAILFLATNMPEKRGWNFLLAYRGGLYSKVPLQEGFRYS